MLVIELIKEAINILDMAREKIERKGAKFVLIFLPRAEECLSGKYSSDISQISRFDVKDYFPYEENALARLKFKDDNHWNAEGHKIAAKAIFDTLVENGIIERQYIK